MWQRRRIQIFSSLYYYKFSLHVITYGLGMNFPTTRTSFLLVFSHEYSHYFHHANRCQVGVLLLGFWHVDSLQRSFSVTTKWTIIFFLSYWVKFTQMSFKWSKFNLHSPSYAILASCVLDSEFRIEYLFEIHATSWKRIVFDFTSTNRCTYSIDLFFQEWRKLLFYDLRLRLNIWIMSFMSAFKQTSREQSSTTI